MSVVYIGEIVMTMKQEEMPVESGIKAHGTGLYFGTGGAVFHKG